MKMKIIDQTDEFSYVALSGRLDMTGVQQVERKFLQATAEQRIHTIVDLADLEFMSSFGMGMLMKCASVLKLNNAKLILLDPQPAIEELLRVSGLTQFFEVVYDKEEALARIRGE